ncbi:hypothetical protein ACIPUP_08925 [Pectobacterium actinidiae]|uniref:Uncharacterized protein n=1 Tax=Pectobacterium actinidiae TaxID=1507808 RepID=A0ABW8G9C4_9GAMM
MKKDDAGIQCAVMKAGYVFVEAPTTRSESAMIRVDCIAAIVDVGESVCEVHLSSGSKVEIKRQALTLMEDIRDLFEAIREKNEEWDDYLPKIAGCLPNWQIRPSKHALSK